MGVFYKLKKNTIKGSKANGKWYAHIASTGTMSYEDLCKHIATHGSVYTEDVCIGVAKKLATCMLEMLLEGKKVEFGDLGTFYLACKSEGTEQVSGFSAAEHIGGLYLRFATNKKRGALLDSKQLRKRTTVSDINSLSAKAAIDAKEAEEQAAAEGGV